MLPGRRGQRWGAILGLFAIWFQSAVLFPHICPDDIARLVAGHFGSTVASVSDAPDVEDLPLCPLSDGRGGDGCLIYMAVHLGGCPLLPPAISIGPFGHRLPETTPPRELHLPRAHYLLFVTRAPPLV